jgi:hypothetical protein
MTARISVMIFTRNTARISAEVLAAIPMKMGIKKKMMTIFATLV